MYSGCRQPADLCSPGKLNRSKIIREAVATARNPVMMYSIGKDSSVMLHLARKAFHPATPPFPLLHVDTGWKFRDCTNTASGWSPRAACA
ncbi:MAG: phosphoadenosine phosphosulfate reductase family protein [Vicinamibacterales bacterium]